jgi:hypothetical protein
MGVFSNRDTLKICRIAYKLRVRLRRFLITATSTYTEIHSEKVRIGIWFFSKVPGFVCDLPFSVYFFHCCANSRSIVAALILYSFFLVPRYNLHLLASLYGPNDFFENRGKPLATDAVHNPPYLHQCRPYVPVIGFSPLSSSPFF